MAKHLPSVIWMLSRKEGYPYGGRWSRGGPQRLPVVEGLVRLPRARSGSERTRMAEAAAAALNDAGESASIYYQMD